MARGIRKFEAQSHTTDMTVRTVHLILKGVPAKDVAQDSLVSLRTVYRWRKEIVAMESVQVDGWTAVFVRRRYRPPLRISAWERAA